MNFLIRRQSKRYIIISIYYIFLRDISVEKTKKYLRESSQLTFTYNNRNIKGNFTPFSSISVVGIEQVNVFRVSACTQQIQCKSIRKFKKWDHHHVTLFGSEN